MPREACHEAQKTAGKTAIVAPERTQNPETTMPRPLLRTAIATVLVIAALAVTAAARADEPKRILAFGDALTWGRKPATHGAPARLPTSARWPAAMQAALGRDYVVIDDGLNGRTTDLPDRSNPPANLSTSTSANPSANSPAQSAALDGSAALPGVLARAQPLDVVVIMLGGSELTAQGGRTPARIAEGMDKLVQIVKDMHGGISTLDPSPKVLVVAPPPVAVDAAADPARADTAGKWAQLAKAYAAVAQKQHVEFLDAAMVVRIDGVDGAHLTAASQQKLGRAIAEKVRAMTK
jgi:lysophospholipase L1-like esterase